MQVKTFTMCEEALTKALCIWRKMANLWTQGPHLHFATAAYHALQIGQMETRVSLGSLYRHEGRYREANEVLGEALKLVGFLKNVLRLPLTYSYED